MQFLEDSHTGRFGTWPEQKPKQTQTLPRINQQDMDTRKVNVNDGVQCKKL